MRTGSRQVSAVVGLCALALALGVERLWRFWWHRDHVVDD